MMKVTSLAVDLLLWAWQLIKMYEEVMASLVKTVSFCAGNAHQVLIFEFLQFEKCSQDGHVPDDAQLWSVVIGAVRVCVVLMAAAELSEIPWRVCCGTKKCVSCERVINPIVNGQNAYSKKCRQKRNNKIPSKFALEPVMTAGTSYTGSN